MKKFTFLLSLLLASSGVTASAQDARSWVKLSADANLENAVTDLSKLTDGGTYAFYSVGQSKYITIDNFDNLHFGRAASLAASNAEVVSLCSSSISQRKARILLTHSKLLLEANICLLQLTTITMVVPLQRQHQLRSLFRITQRKQTLQPKPMVSS